MRSLFQHRLIGPFLIFCGCLLVRLCMIFYLDDDQTFFPVQDFVEKILAIAANLAGGKGFSIFPGEPTAIAAPLFPSLISLVILIFGNGFLAMRLAMAVIDAASCLLFYSIARDLIDRRTGFFFFLLYTCYPPLLWSVEVLALETLFIFFLSLFFLLMIKWYRHRSVRYGIAAGAALGLCALCRATALLLPLPVLLGFIYSDHEKQGAIIRQLKDGGWKNRKSLIAFSLACTLVISVWIGRNYHHFETFIPIQSLGGFHFYCRTEQAASFEKADPAGTHYLPTKINKIDIGQKMEKNYFNAGIHNMISHPRGYLMLMGKRLCWLWYATYDGKYERELLFLNLTILLGAVIGTALLRRDGKPSCQIWMIVLYFVLVHLFFHTMARYAIPVYPFLLILNAYWITKLSRIITPSS